MKEKSINSHIPKEKSTGSHIPKEKSIGSHIPKEKSIGSHIPLLPNRSLIAFPNSKRREIPFK